MMVMMELNDQRQYNSMSNEICFFLMEKNCQINQVYNNGLKPKRKSLDIQIIYGYIRIKLTDENFEFFRGENIYHM